MFLVFSIDLKFSCRFHSLKKKFKTLDIQIEKNIYELIINKKYKEEFIEESHISKSNFILKKN